MRLLAFVILAFGPLAVDMYHRRDGNVGLKSASIWSSIYIGSALLFALFLYAWSGAGDASLFLSGWTIEKSLSVDNLLVFGAIFAYFGVESKYQYRVLHVGIIGAVVLRLVFISFGLFMFAIFGRLLDVVFGGFVLWTAFQMQKAGDAVPVIDHNARWYIRLTRDVLPVSGEMSEKFFIRSPFGFLKAAPTATPLFLCLVAVECTDIAFAFDSVPAVLGVTRDMLLVYSSIMFAVVGLRSLYFVLESVMRYTANLKMAMTGVLLFIGGNMMLHGVLGIELPPTFTLAVIVGAFLVCGAGFFRKDKTDAGRKSTDAA